MRGYHSKTLSTTVLEIHVQVITQKLFKTIGELQSAWLQHEY